MAAQEPPHKPVIRFLLTQLLYGSLGAAVFCWAILHFDTGGLASMIRRSNEPFLWQLLLYFGNWVTFGGVAMAVAIMRLGEETDDHPGTPPENRPTSEEFPYMQKYVIADIVGKVRSIGPTRKPISAHEHAGRMGYQERP